jgi:Tfp pilus assembly protein PilO
MKFKSLYLWYALPFVIIVVWFLTVYMPVTAKITLMAGQAGEIAVQKNRIEGQIQEIVGRKRSYTDLRTKAIELESQLPSVDKFPQFMSFLFKTVRTEGLLLESFDGTFRSLDAEQASFLITPLFNVGLKGSFIEMGKFLEALSNRRVYGRILTARISSSEKEYPLLRGRFLVEFRVRKDAASENQ